MSAALLFAVDFDGVIADSAQAYADAINAAAQPLGADRRMSTELMARMPSFQHRDSARLMGLAEHQLSAYSEALSDIFHRLETPPLHRPMRALLQQLSAAGELLVLSANEQRVLASALGPWQLRNTVYCGGHGGAAKAQKLHQLARRAQVLMIGDTLSDCEAAAAAGVDCFAVAWGWQGAQILQAAEVPIARDVDQLKRWLSRWIDRHGGSAVEH